MYADYLRNGQDRFYTWLGPRKAPTLRVSSTTDSG
jgi:hypothetical protein